MIQEKAQVIALPIEKEYYHKYPLKGLFKDKEGKWSEYPNTAFYIPYYLYFFTDEEIEEGDWYIVLIRKNVYGLRQALGEWWDKINDSSAWKMACRKVVKTTNPKLWEKSEPHFKGMSQGHEIWRNETTQIGIPRIPTDFIETYVKAQGKIGKVLLEYEVDMENTYETWTPDGMKECAVKRLKLNSQGAVVIHKVKPKLYNRDDLKAFGLAVLSMGINIRQNQLQDYGTDKSAKEQYNDWFNENYPQ